ncbi:Dual specificity tyrosine-phosphorylation-regulated kinase 4 isoform A [Senna tora]|uniref:Dual specificity tyrosine-phosphorylation-regulated kinase 4 isoform A n=1 Tax=Senna tora TaxID=362788 RepID=A0A834T3B0_9FABA|nr:Dual specificity tyrosine-phosphorylation-regulated kinase 4 isoform A [Senna tora]
MEDTNSVGVILDFLRRNQFTRAEAALRSELNNRHDLDGFHQKLTLEEKAVHDASEKDKERPLLDNQGLDFHDNVEVSTELIVKEIECGTGRNVTESKFRSTPYIGERKKSAEVVGASDKNFTFPKSSEDSVLDLYSWKLNPSNGPVEHFQNDGGSSANNSLKTQVSQKSKHQTSEALDMINRNTKSGEENTVPAEQSYDGMQAKQPKELDRQPKSKNSSFKENFADNPWLKTDENESSSSDLWKDCSVKTVFPFSKGDTSATYNGATYSGYKGEKGTDIIDIRASMKAQVDEVGRAIYAVKSQGSSEEKTFGSLNFPVARENQKEELPRLPPVKLKSEDKSLTVNWEEKFERHEPASKLAGADNNLLIGSYLDVPVGQEINPAGMRRAAGGSWLSVSQGITEDTSDLVSGFATVGDGCESVDYPNEYWDSDEYDDDDDVGYMRQPIEDEAWFLAHEIDYPSDNEKATGHGSVPDPQDRSPAKEEDDDQSFAEEDSYFSGEQYVQAKNVEAVITSDDPIGLTITEVYGRTNKNELMAQYDGQLMDEEELNLMRAEPVWQGFVSQTNELVLLGDGKAFHDSGRSKLEDICIDDDHHSSVRSIGVGINSDAADIGSEVRESLVGGSSEGDLEYLCDRDVGVDCSRNSRHDLDKKSLNKLNKSKKKNGKNEGAFLQMNSHTDGGFSFPLSLKDGQVIQPASSKPLWSNKCNADENDDHLNAFVRPDDMLTPWRQKSSDSSPIKSSRDENNANTVGSTNSSPTAVSNYGYAERAHVKLEEDEKVGIAEEEELGASLEDEEAAAVQEQLRQIKAQEEEFETFNLKIVHRKNRTGFEEDKNFHVVLNSVIAGRYHVTEYLGSAAFSKAIQAHDLHTGMDVCVKIIKNNKDFFDQSLDEIKLLKYVNKHDPADKYHILRLYDYFYYREHLLIVCELLKANLYEFHKFNRESGGEVYFTMPRLQSITIQCLEALQFLHSLGLIHCDLKPENILVKSYSRCEVKVIDLGSSCYETDHLCSYVQSRSYRAPEVILGLSYDKKIDVWSLGCILAELCTGNVLFQNDSPATLLARVIGIIGPIDQAMLAKGRDTYKYFTKNHMLYERNQETNRLEYLIPKKTSLRHRLPMGDQGFIDFVGYLLEINPKKRPSASEALKHPWLSYPYEPISS